LANLNSHLVFVIEVGDFQSYSFHINDERIPENKVKEVSQKTEFKGYSANCHFG